VAAGARIDRSGGWLRPFTYGDRPGEYLAVRERVSVMDVGTLGVHDRGTRPGELVDRLYPCRTDDLAPGRTRYVLTLDEAGYVMDDGLLARVDEHEWYLNSTSGGAGRTDARLRNFADRLELDVHVLEPHGPVGRDQRRRGRTLATCFERLTDDPIDRNGRSPIRGSPTSRSPGSRVDAIRTGVRARSWLSSSTTPRTRAGAVGDDLEAGSEWELRHTGSTRSSCSSGEGPLLPGPGHDADDTPAKLGMSWAVAMDKPWFVGKKALERMAELPIGRPPDRPPSSVGGPSRRPSCERAARR